MSQHKDKVLETFLRTIYINFNVKDNDLYRINTVKSYIPAIVFIDYDGYLVYAAAEFVNAQGAEEYKQIWYPKKGYSLEDDAGNIISFTLDSYVYIYNQNTRESIEGYWEDVKDKSEILNVSTKDEFETIKRSCIISHIEKDLGFFVNEHNHFAVQNGIIYNFYFTAVPKDNWDRAIDDIGLIAFVQGIPVGVKERFNSFAVGGSNIIKKQKIVGFIDTDTNNKYYIRESELSTVNLTYDNQLIKVFDSMNEAAKNGYSPY